MTELRTIEAFVVDSVKDVPLPSELPGCPLSTEARRLLMANCPVYMIDPFADQASLPYTPQVPVETYDTSEFRIWQPGPRHNRSFALGGPNLNKPWEDEHGNRYGSFTLKGINFTKPGVLESNTATDGVVAWGLQESKIIERVLKAADVMSSRGISTERIIGLAEPKEYPWPVVDKHTDAHEYVSLSTYKQRIIDDYWRELPEDKQTVEELADITRKFSDMTFFISLRIADTAYRLHDLRDEEALEDVFIAVNENYLAPDQKPFSVDEPYVLSRYVTEFFAPRAGKNLARLHPDLAHGFANDLNWTALGGLVDLDSIHGEALGMGDEPITDTDRFDDLINITAAIFRFAPLDDGPELRSSFVGVQNFLRAYFEETIAIMGDRQKARDFIGATIVAGHPENLTSDDMTLAGYTIQCFCEEFFSAEEGDRFQTALAQSIDESLNNENLAKKVAVRMQDRMLDYSRRLVEEYINEFTDPDFDIVGKFVGSPKYTDVWSEIVDDIGKQIMAFNASKLIDSSSLPADIMSIENPKLREMLIAYSLGQQHDKVKKLAQEIATDNVPLIEDRLRGFVSHYSRPYSVMPDEASRVFTSSRPMRLWLGTEDVSLNKVMDKVLTEWNSDWEPSSLRVMPQPTKAGEYVFNIANDDMIDQIITDGEIGSSQYDSDGQGTYTLVSIDGKNTKYVAFVTEPVDGKRKFYLYVNDYNRLIGTMMGHVRTQEKERVEKSGQGELF